MRQEKDQVLLLMKFLNREFIRFIIVGLINTISTYLIYLFLLNFISYNVSYIISYISGVAIAFILNSSYVFKTKITLRKTIKYPLVYLFQYIINALVLNILIKNGVVNEILAPVLVVVFSIPVTYLLTKFILKGKG